MAKSTTSQLTTAELNERAFAAKEQRRLEKADYPIERKLQIVQKLRDATRELRTGSSVIVRGTVKRR